MPKPSTPKTKTKTKTQLKAKRNTKSTVPGLTTKKSYWLMLSVVMVIVFSVVGYIIGLSKAGIAVLMITILLLIGLIGYVRITPSRLPKFKRAILLFAGASVIGFSIWAVIVVALLKAELIDSVFVDPFLLVPSLIICLTVGAFIGELLGKNSRIQASLSIPRDGL